MLREPLEQVPSKRAEFAQRYMVIPMVEALTACGRWDFHIVTNLDISEWEGAQC